MRVSTTTVARFWLDQQGSALIEGAAMVPLLILFFAGVFEFSWFLYQQHLVTIGLHDAASYLARSLNPCNPTSRSWKAELEQAKNLATAAKAVQIGARLAAVSDPVALGLNNVSRAVVDETVPPGAAMPKFIVTCDGGSATCSCSGVAHACRQVRGYNKAAMDTIVFGRGSSSCSNLPAADRVGMCNILSRITPANVKIVYAQTGLGYAERPGGPMPTITLSLQNLPFHFYFEGGLVGLRDLQVPASTSSRTAEDLSSHAPTF
jgi:TadE-like protein